MGSLCQVASGFAPNNRHSVAFRTILKTAVRSYALVAGAGGNAHGRVEHVTDTLHTVYAAGQPCVGEQLADGSFGFVYRRWVLDL
jgi:hypothetical protein